MTTAPSSPSDHHEYRQLLSDPRVRAYLRKKLATVDLSPVEKEDVLSSVMEALWRRRVDQDPPRTIRRVLALARKIVKGKLVDVYRRKDAVATDVVDAATICREKGHELPPACEQPNYVDKLPGLRSMTPEDALAAKQKLEFVAKEAKIGMTDDDIESMTAYECGESTIEELAAERGMTGGALRTRLHRLHYRLNKAWARHSRIRLVMILLVLALTIFYALALGPGRKPPPPPPPAPTVNAPAPVAPATEEAPVRNAEPDPDRKK